MLTIFPFDAICDSLAGLDRQLVCAAFNPMIGTLHPTRPFDITCFGAQSAYLEACANYVWGELYREFGGDGDCAIGRDTDICKFYTARWRYGDSDAFEEMREKLVGLDVLVGQVIEIVRKA